MTYVVENSDGEVKCAALWEPAQSPVWLYFYIFKFIAFLFWNFGFATARRISKMFFDMEAERHKRAPNAYHLAKRSCRYFDVSSSSFLSEYSKVCLSFVHSLLYHTKKNIVVTVHCSFFLSFSDRSSGSFFIN
uniref:Uncharacterized protein n=1 Tax=Aureoumbra lagunensis TaxID=44058 RepID=A0A7S3JXF1_9STRA